MNISGRGVRRDQTLTGMRLSFPYVPAIQRYGSWDQRFGRERIDLTRYRNMTMTFFRNRAGIFIMLTPRMDWDTAMTAYDTRNNVEMAFDIFKNELDGKRGRTGDPVRARGRLFIKFLALMIRVRMQLTVSESDIKGLTVDNMLMSSSTYKS